MRARLAIAIAVVAGCYHEPTLDPTACTLRCTSTCPDELACVDGYCVADGQSCETVPPPTTFAHVAAGDVFACGLDTDGAIWCWGDNRHHEVASSEVQTFTAATKLDDGTWDALAVGGGHACGLQAGTLSCWGSNGANQASATAGDVALPTAVTPPAPTTRWLAVSASLKDTCAIATADGSATSGTLYCWGDSAGIVGGAVPTAVTTSITDWTSVTLGLEDACAISASSGLYCWGNNDAGQLGTASGSASTSPIAIALPAAPTSVGLGVASICATTADGALYCWGDNSNGELGDNVPGTSSAVPVLASTLTGWTKVAGALRTVCGLVGDAVMCWGQEFNGGLGNGEWYSSNVFGTTVATGATDVSLGMTSDTAFEGNTTNVVGEYDDLLDRDLGCAIVAGEPACWGDNRYGQLGIGVPPTMHAGPVEVVGGHTFTKLVVGNDHACAIEATTQALYCWGATEQGQTNGTPAGGTNVCVVGQPCDLAEPTAVSFITNVTDVAANAYDTCALGVGDLGSDTPAITCWGDSVADETGSMFHVIDQVGATFLGSPFTGLYATGNGQAQCATTMAGSAVCWGVFQGSAQVPADDTAVLGGSVTAPVLRVAFGLGLTGGGSDAFGCALVGSGTGSAGELSCWGGNGAGEFGEGDFNSAVAFHDTGAQYTTFGVADFADVMCGAPAGSAAATQPIVCAGDNRYDELGTKTGSTSATPLAIGGISAGPCTAIAIGQQHACAICASDLYCWGADEFGQLGSGSFSADPQYLPSTVAPPPGDSWSDVGAGSDFTCALTAMGKVECWGLAKHGALGDGSHAANLPTPIVATH